MVEELSENHQGMALPVRGSGAAAVGVAAFEEVYRELAPLLRNIAIWRFKIPVHEAQALVHDVFASYLANPAVVRGELRPYFIAAIWNASRAYLRKHRGEQSLEGVPVRVTAIDRDI